MYSTSHSTSSIFSYPGPFHDPRVFTPISPFLDSSFRPAPASPPIILPKLQHHQPRHPSIILHSLYNRPIRLLIQPLHHVHIIPAQLKIVHIRILLDPTRRVALRQRHPPLLETVPDENLSGRFVVFLCEGKEGGIVGFAGADEGRVGFYYYAVFVAVGDYGFLLAPGVELWTHC